ncbi:MAG: FAD-dependent oxidoreductase [Clostridia bacterium]|nr:FAD-dependent oxidoreductase [Clostridia bacterium]
MAFQKIKHQVDLCVVGGGLSGMCAAIAAARGGSKVALIHDRPVLGGNASSEIRMWICGARETNNRETGIIEEIELTSLWRNPDKNYYIWDGILFEKIKNEPNITLLLNCSVCDAEMEEDTIRSVTGWQTTTQQWHRVEATYFSDCSGDSVLAPLTGAEFRVGREGAKVFGEDTPLKESDRKTMGMSCLLQLRKSERPTKYIAPEWATKLSQELLNTRRPNMERSSENFWYLELGGNRDSIHDTEAVRDELVALAYGMLDYIKNSGEVADADYWELDWMGFLPGKRESRRMMGPYVLTERDITMETPFDDTVAYGGWPMDNHHPDGFYHVGKPTTYGDTPSPYRIPYRCLYSVNIENLWFAGRNISTSHLAMSSTRVMATCALLGEAVGTAANIAREFNLTPNGVYLEKIKLLQQRLMENGCFLPYLKREIADVCKAATLSCEGVEHLENLRNGMDRNHFTYGEGDRRVTLAAGKAVTYTFEQPTVLENVHLNFDSDLDRDTLPGDQCERRHSMRANRNFDSPTMCMPKTLVKGYSLSAVTAEGETLLIAETDCNLLGCVNFELPDRPLKSVSFIPHETWGSEDMKIFSFDVR